jgi:hypothetical protein
MWIAQAWVNGLTTQTTQPAITLVHDSTLDPLVRDTCTSGTVSVVLAAVACTSTGAVDLVGQLRAERCSAVWTCALVRGACACTCSSCTCTVVVLTLRTVTLDLKRCVVMAVVQPKHPIPGHRCSTAQPACPVVDRYRLRVPGGLRLQPRPSAQLPSARAPACALRPVGGHVSLGAHLARLCRHHADPTSYMPPGPRYTDPSRRGCTATLQADSLL